MLIRKVGAKIVRDSRWEKTILVWVRTDKGKFRTISPSGKSTGKYEVKCYLRSLENEVKYVNKLKVEKLQINKFEDLKRIEKYVRLGGNSLFALEASLLKALAKENNQELYEFLGKASPLNKFNGTAKIGSVGNAVGGGKHSKGVKGNKPDFQEFHFISKGKNFSENVKNNNEAYKLIGRILWARRRNDEGAWETGVTNEEVLEAMKLVRKMLKKKGISVEIGLDIAANSFFKKKYKYNSPEMVLTREQQIGYIASLIERFDLFYVEDGLEENDFNGFSEVLKKTKKKCLIVGDDLTTTNPTRLKKAIKAKSINGIIVKPNQIGSLLKVKEVIDICKKNKIKTIISHRSGESLDDTIADLGVGWNVDFIKTGIYGRVRRAKLKRLRRIEKKINGKK